MRFINAVVILFALTICSWKCGQANAAPAFWDDHTNEHNFDTNEYFNKYKHKQDVFMGSIFTHDTVELNNTQTLNIKKETHDGHGSSYSLWSQNVKYGPIRADRGIFINTIHAIHGFESQGNASNEERKDPLNVTINQNVSYDQLISDGPIIIHYTQTSD